MRQQPDEEPVKKTGLRLRQWCVESQQHLFVALLLTYLCRRHLSQQTCMLFIGCLGSEALVEQRNG